ncbi:SMI1-KNR4 cell-wall [Neptunomonas qingdaonensis]|uniref:SMI1-KNR4 cell-wall n=3 Tax=Neptunomonas TaxID=75687 RepID=A0A1I2U3T9_9GAMM|nr:SMI1-KNR4 cell-wall [Neptunomonas qingdaonensis]
MAPASGHPETDMNDVIDELRELNQDRFNSMRLPTEDELVELEEEILISIPADLKEFLLEASDVVYGSLSPVTATEPHEQTHLPELTATAWSLGLPRELIPICEANDGYYFIEQDGSIGFWSAEEEVSEEQWDNLWDWISDVWLSS